MLVKFLTKSQVSAIKMDIMTFHKSQPHPSMGFYPEVAKRVTTMTAMGSGK